ncbi:hypothetical protein L227DRAFT_136131 [Lentinus tigrinus ALCF2SS1-6]|uniref:Uncharacterized protein n=1 Tax=Lentinus tigrinus ALCF2SS1-6 TaxID=1328759 RepID=A0A5C2SSZ6_9APHY|nr:hypothetical protein L227DRAFT_136131 [Lentinus tigrinus ALCF2SS1-6]
METSTVCHSTSAKASSIRSTYYSPDLFVLFFLALPPPPAAGDSECLLFNLTSPRPEASAGSSVRIGRELSPAWDCERDLDEETAEDAADDLPRCRRGRRERLDTVVGAGRGGERVRSTGVARALEFASDIVQRDLTGWM